MTKEQLASLAQGLKDNEALVGALKAMREDALEAVAATDPVSPDVIRLHQARVRAVDEFRDRLEQFIRSGRAANPAGIA